MRKITSMVKLLQMRASMTSSANDDISYAMASFMNNASECFTKYWHLHALA